MPPRESLIKTMPLLALAGLLLWSPGVSGQSRTVVANQVEVSRGDASLHLEFSDGERLTVSFEEGTARVDGRVIGEYQAGGDADQAWRALLSEVLSLNNGALARALQRWQPDPDLDDDELALLRDLDRVLDVAVAQAAEAGQRKEGGAAAREGVEEFLRVLLRSNGLGALVEALGETDVDDLQIRMGEDHRVPRGETVDGSLLVVDGDLEIRGRVTGDVILVDGRLSMGDGGVVDGDVRLIDASLGDEGGDIRGSVVDVDREIRRNRSRIREEIRTELRNEVRRSQRDHDRSYGFVGRAGRAVGGLIESLVTFVLVGLLALAVTRFAGSRVDSVSEAIRENPARSAAVGFAGAFLIVPIYVLGILVLTVSIVGIPALLIWGPLFPLAVALGAFVGYVSVGHHVGRWILNHDFAKLNWVDQNNENHVKLVGIGALLIPFAAAGLIRVLPLVGWMGNLVAGLGTLACLAALIMGFGAVIITRGGRFANYGFDVDLDVNADWSSTRDDMEDPLVGDDVPFSEDEGNGA